MTEKSRKSAEKASLPHGFFSEVGMRKSSKAVSRDGP